jgi:hypothetical protein
MADADDSYDLEHIEPFVAELQAGDTDIVMGDRFRGGIQPGAMPWKNRYIGNPLLSRLLAVLFGGNVHDANCGLRSFTREAYRRISPTAPGMEFASELIVKALLHGLSIQQVPTTLSPDGRDRPPHLSPWRDGWRHLMFMSSLAPAHVCILPAVICAVLGVVTMIAVNGQSPVVGLTFAAAALCWAQLYLLGRIYMERHVLRCSSSTKHKVLQPAKIANVFSEAGLIVAAVSALLLALGMVSWIPALIAAVAGVELFSFGTIVLLLGSGAEGVSGDAGFKSAVKRTRHGMANRNPTRRPLNSP